MAEETVHSVIGSELGTNGLLARQQSGELPLTPQWMLTNKDPVKAAGGITNSQLEHTREKWRSDMKPKFSDKWAPSVGVEKDAGTRDRLGGDTVTRGARWRGDERENVPRRDVGRWEAFPEDGARWTDTTAATGGADFRYGDRWAEAPGRGKPRAEDKWNARERDPWFPPSADLDVGLTRPKWDRWDAGQDPSNRWRVGGAAFDADGRGGGVARSRGFAAGRGRDVKGAPGSHAPGAPPTDSVLTQRFDDNVKYSRNDLLGIYNSLSSSKGSPLPMPAAADVDNYGLLSGDDQYGENGEPEPPQRPKLRQGEETGGNKGTGGTGAAGGGAAAAATETKGQANSGAGGGGDRWSPQDAPPAGGTAGNGGEAPAPGGSAAAGGQAGGAPVLTISPSAFAADQWVYRDPSGQVQGPFPKVDIIDWFEAGFFPPDLPMKSAVDPPDTPFLPLTTMLKMWAHISANHAPPGFVAMPATSLAPAPAPAQPAAAPQATPTSLPQQHQAPLQPGLDPTAANPNLAAPTTTPTSTAHVDPHYSLQYPNTSAPPAGQALHHQPALAQPSVGGVPDHLAPVHGLGGAMPLGQIPQISLSPWSTAPAQPAAAGANSAANNPWLHAPLQPPASWTPGPGGPSPHTLHLPQLHETFSSSLSLAAPSASPHQPPPAADSHSHYHHSPVAPPPNDPHSPQLPQHHPAPTLASSPQQHLPAPSDWHHPNSQALSFAHYLQPTPPTPDSTQAQLAQDALAPPHPHAAYPPPPPAATRAPQPTQPSHAYTPAPQPFGSVQQLPPHPQDEALPQDQAAPGKPTAAASTAPKAPATGAAAPPPAAPRAEPQASAEAAKTAAPKPVTKAAPWAAAVPQVPAAKSLLQIQEEEARTVAIAVEAAMDSVASIPPPAPAAAERAAAAAAAPAAAQAHSKQPTQQAPWGGAANKTAAPAPPAQPAPAGGPWTPAGKAPAAAKPAAAAPAPAPSKPAAAAAPAPTAWGAAAGAGAGAPTAAAGPVSSMRDIFSEQQQRPATPPSPPTGTGPGPRRGTIGEALSKHLKELAPSASNKGGGPAWGADSGRPHVADFRDILAFEECAADLEGGSCEEDIDALLAQVAPPPHRPYVPPPPVESPAPWVAAQANAPPAASLQQIQMEEKRQRELQQQQQQQRQQAAAPAAAAGDEELLFTLHGGLQPANLARSPAPKAVEGRGSGGVQAAAPTAADVARSAVAAATSFGGRKGWAAAAAVPSPAAPAPQTAAAKLRRAPAPTPAPPAAANPPPAPARPAAAAPVATPPPAAQDTSPVLMFGNLQLSDDFIQWARQQMLHFNGNADLTAIEFLWALPSGGEVADTCQMLWPGKSGISSFVAEFWKRKAAELNRKPGSKKKKSGSAASSVAAVAAEAPKSVQNGGGQVAAEPVVGSGWNAVVVGKKGKKGKK